MNKNIGVIGLGLIGGSIAKAIKKNTEHEVFGFDKNEKTLSEAIAIGAIDNVFDNASFAQCEIIIIALYPEDTKKFFRDNVDKFKRGTVVVDCAGVKEVICNELSKLANDHGIYFIGGHPMAGTEFAGFENSYAELFVGAPMVLCNDANVNSVALKAAELFFLSLGFGSVNITTAKEHDIIIAFTSQLAHIVSNAYIKSETAKNHDGLSAGSYQDLTRVAKLNEYMWTELFMDNKENLIGELDSLISRLTEYNDALKNSDVKTMEKLLADGRIAKERLG
jgi:prephenate dehydrogenase